MLFHVTITHDARDCPGRRPGEPPELIGPSDRRAQLARDLHVSLHLVLWGASCILWAQPEHVTYAVLEADDLQAVFEYLAGITPAEWTFTAVPVWNLPSQLRLVRSVLSAATGLGQSQEPQTMAPAAAEATAPKRGGVHSETTPLAELAGALGSSAASGPRQEPPATAGAVVAESSGTITRLFQALDASAESATVIPAAATPERLLTLQCTAGPAEGTRFEVGAARVTIGRLSGNPIYIPDGRLSRTHASIQWRDDGFWLTDLGSLNGTAVNGVLLTSPRRLETGDSIELGATRLAVTVAPGSP